MQLINLTKNNKKKDENSLASQFHVLFNIIIIIVIIHPVFL